MVSTEPNSKTATVDWVNLRIQEVEKTTVSDSRTAIVEELKPVKDELNRIDQRYVLRSSVVWVPRVFWGAIAVAASCISSLFVWIGKLHGFW